MIKPAKQAGAYAQEDALDHARGAANRSSLLATVISAVALLFSAYSVYESVLRSPQLAIYVPPRIDYTDPDSPDSPFEVFIMPITLANDGARSGTVLSVDLEVTNRRTKQVKSFYAARLGAWMEQPVKPFAPVSLAGRTSFSDALQFFPRNGESVSRILDLEPGTYGFKLTLQTAAREKDGLSALIAEGGDVAPLEFQMQIGQMDYRNFQGSGTMAMWAPDYKSASTGGAP